MRLVYYSSVIVAACVQITLLCLAAALAWGSLPLRRVGECVETSWTYCPANSGGVRTRHSDDFPGPVGWTDGALLFSALISMLLLLPWSKAALQLATDRMWPKNVLLYASTGGCLLVCAGYQILLAESGARQLSFLDSSTIRNAAERRRALTAIVWCSLFLFVHHAVLSIAGILVNRGAKMSTGVELNPAQGAAFEALVRRRHHVMVNCGPGMGKTLLGIDFAPALLPAMRSSGPGARTAWSPTLWPGAFEGVNLQRLLSELRKIERGYQPSEFAKAHSGLMALLKSIKTERPVLIFIDECGLINAKMFDDLLAVLCAINPRCFGDALRAALHDGRLCKPASPVEGDAFIFSHLFQWVRSNTWFAHLTQQHRFSETGNVGRDVQMLLAANNTELTMYLQAHQNAYRKADREWLAGLPTFVTSRQACEQHIRNALAVLIDGRQLSVNVVSPPATHANSTASMTTEATYYQVDGWVSMVEVTTMGGPLQGTTEDGETVLIPNRHQCVLYDVFDAAKEETACNLKGKAAASLGYRDDPDADYKVVTVPLIHEKDSTPCVTLRSVGFEDEAGDTVLSCYLAFNAQGYEYPGTLAVGALDVDRQLPLSREALLVVATRTPDGPAKVLYHPALKLQAGNKSKYEAYRRKLAEFTPDPRGVGNRWQRKNARWPRRRARAASRKGTETEGFLWPLGIPRAHDLNVLI